MRQPSKGTCKLNSARTWKILQNNTCIANTQIILFIHAAVWSTYSLLARRCNGSFIVTHENPSEDWSDFMCCTGWSESFVWLCGFYYRAFHVESCLALCSRVFQSRLALWSPRLGKAVYVLLEHLFVYFACVNFCPFSLPPGVRGWLPLVIVALPGLFY